jgi:hypothetical protein
VKDQVKYLGMRISRNRDLMKKQTAATIKKYLSAFKGRLRVADP